MNTPTATTPGTTGANGRTAADDDAIRPFDVAVPDAALDDLKRRIDAVHWPTKELVSDRSQGVQLATMEALARYWRSDYDWRTCERQLNSLQQFKTRIDGVDVHFIHAPSPHENALPLIITHGWPGSVIEMLEVIAPLTDPTAHGGTGEDAFHVVIPSIPGYGFSAQPSERGWSAGRVRQGLAEVDGPTRLPALRRPGRRPGGSRHRRDGPRGAQGTTRHPHEPAGPGARETAGLPAETDEERAAAEALKTFHASGFGYFLEQATRPQTIGYALLDSPVSLAAWMLDHDTDSYYKITSAFVDGKPAGNLTRDHILDNITTYWLTGTGASAARSYWEGGRRAPCRRPDAPAGLDPGRLHDLPGRDLRAPRSWVEKAYPSLAYFNEVDRGGHFAAWEEPEQFSAELREAFRPLR